jgi:hypothetical protein
MCGKGGDLRGGAGKETGLGTGRTEDLWQGKVGSCQGEAMELNER